MATTSVKSFGMQDTLREAWEVVRENPMQILLVYVVGGVVPQVLFAILKSLLGDDGFGLFDILSQIIMLVVSMGLMKAFLDIVRKQEVDVSMLWTDTRRVVNFVAASFLYMLIVLGGFILLIVPGVIWSIQFRYYGYLIIEENLGPVEALKRSSVVTDGVKWNLFLFDLLLGLVIILGALALIVGLIVAIPVAALAQVILFLKLQKMTKQVETAQA